ncbi:MAG: TldD/PmbA family protein, partial [Bacillota bacterium]
MDEIKFAKDIISIGKDMEIDDIEVFYSSSKNLEVVWENGDLQIPKTDFYQGFGVRVFKNGSTGFSSSNILKDDEGEKVLKRAAEIASVTPSDENNTLAEKNNIEEVEGLVDKKNNNMKLVDAIEKGNEFVEAFLNYDKRVKLDTANFSTKITKRMIVNSNGIEAEEEKTIFEVMGMAFAREGENVSSFDIAFQNTCKLDELDLQQRGKELAQKVVNSLDAEKINSFKGSVILSPFSALSLLAGPLSFAVNGENVINGMSPWASQLGEKVAIEGL